MIRSKVFTNDGSQAANLPADVACPSDVQEVTILRDGPRRMLVPTEMLWDDFFASPGVDLGEREQPAMPVARRLS